MKYALVSTSNYILLVNIKKKVAIPIENNRCEYYGISWFQNSKNLVLSHSGISNDTLVDIASYSQSERGWLSHGQQNSRKFLSQPHQILCTPEGTVICTNTGRNCITIIDFDKPNFFCEVSVGESRWDRLSLSEDQGDHLNSVLLENDRLHVVGHGHSHGSLLACFSYPSLELNDIKHIKNRTGLHNIWITQEGQRISCHSAAGCLIDIDSNAPLWEAGGPRFIRGLAASGDYVLLGESQKLARNLPASSLCGLWIVDRTSWKALDYISLGPFGAIHDVRLLDVPDEAHHTMPFKGLNNLIGKPNLFDRLSKDRLLRARTAEISRQIWSNYRLVYGSPEAMESGAKRACPDDLCLIVKEQMDPLHRTVSVDYCLQKDTNASHVSAVVGYQGSGSDKYMTALLLERTKLNTAFFSIWHHDGKSWEQKPIAPTGDLPIKGNFTLQITPLEIVVTINKNEILRVDAKVLCNECHNGEIGIRWLGSTIKPVESVPGITQ